MAAQDVQSSLLQGRIIVTVEIVESDNGAALGQQPAGDMKADKAGRTRDEYCSIRHSRALMDRFRSTTGPASF
jgi:hypothetical protein